MTLSRKVLIPLVAVLLIVGLGIGGALVVSRTPKIRQSIENRLNANAASLNNQNANRAIQNTNTQVDSDREAILFVSRNFVERFGSGTSDDKFASMLNAVAWGTNELNDRIRKNVAAVYGNPGPVFRSLTTKALVFNVTSRAASSATVTVGTSRTETIGDEVKTYPQDIRLSLQKIGNDWKVNSAAWEPR